VVVAEWAAFRAFLTAETRPVARTPDKPIPRAAGITMRSRRRQDGDIMELLFISRNPAGTEADPVSYHTPGRSDGRAIALRPPAPRLAYPTAVFTYSESVGIEIPTVLQISATVCFFSR
jgi:hypothetical protein